MGMSAAHCQGNVREFQSVWRLVTLFKAYRRRLVADWCVFVTRVAVVPWAAVFVFFDSLCFSFVFHYY